MFAALNVWHINFMLELKCHMYAPGICILINDTEAES